MARTIKILSPGPIKTMNNVYGPILTPYTVDDNKLRSLLREGLNIVEIMPDKSERKMTLSDMSMPHTEPNKNKGNANKQFVNNKNNTSAPHANSGNIEAPKAETVAPVVSEPVAGTATDDEATHENKNVNKKFNKNKNNE